MSKFIDKARISICSGDGGNGLVAWRREKYEPLGGPAGGDGGNGGSVFLEASRDLSTLIDFHYQNKFIAEPGGRGGPKNKYGRNGKDLIIKLPLGTIVRDVSSKKVIADLAVPGQCVLIAKGGQGGKGNTRMASATRRSPYFCEPGLPGISRELELELKLLADVGIIGLPNAGKSSLLSVLTAARPKIADYPFSTTSPGLGVIKKPEGGGYVIADLPGLIEGAATGVGLGHKFLRHIERTRLLLHLVDISSENLNEDITTIDQELKDYSQKLSRLPRLMVLNKLDLMAETATNKAKDKVVKLIATLKTPYLSIKGQSVMLISCATKQGLKELQFGITKLLDELGDTLPLYEIEPDKDATTRPDTGFMVSRSKKTFTVHGDRVERLVSVTNLRQPESIHHLNQLLRSYGVIDELIKQGAIHGSPIIIGKTEFCFGENLF